MVISLLIFLTLGFLILLSYFSNKFANHGPPSYPFIGCLIAFYKNRYRLLDWYTELLAESPVNTIVVHRIGGPRTIVTANPENVEYMLKNNFNNFPKGRPINVILGDFLGCGIFNVDGEQWRAQRKLASHGFTTKSLRKLVVKTLEDEVEKRLIPVLESAMESNKVVDMQDLLRRFAFDIVCKVSLGFDPGCLDHSLPDSSLARAFDVASMTSAMRRAAPVFLIWKIKRFFGIGTEKTLKEAISHVHESVSEIIRNKCEKLQNITKDEYEDADLLSRLIVEGHDAELVRDMVISFVMAGRDTTSAAMTWLFYLLSRNRNIESELVNEVSRYLDYDELKEMGLLKACLCESMRLYPPVAWDSKHAESDDILPDGTSVRAGDRVTYFPYGMGRMEKLWGKDWFEFKPDRWFIGPESGELKNVSPYKFPVFQAGPRVCLGKEMAFIQMKYVVSSILKRFEIKPVSLENPVFVPLLTAHMAGGFNVRVGKRSQV